jgi:hypothetical protein
MARRKPSTSIGHPGFQNPQDTKQLTIAQNQASSPSFTARSIFEVKGVPQVMVTKEKDTDQKVNLQFQVTLPGASNFSKNKSKREPKSKDSDKKVFDAREISLWHANP